MSKPVHPTPSHTLHHPSGYAADRYGVPRRPINNQGEWDKVTPIDNSGQGVWKRRVWQVVGVVTDRQNG
jgi:hypothetical protein